MNFDRITTENWTVAFPGDWIDKSEEDGTLYFLSSDKEKGFYLSLWVLSDEEQRTPQELIATFQKTEIESFTTNNKDWKLLKSEINSAELPVVGYWEGFNKSSFYRISGKQLANGKLVLRATFHDYHCKNQDLSKKYFAPIIDSLELR